MPSPSLLSVSCIISAFLFSSSASPVRRQNDGCRQTQVLVLGGGIAGVTAAQTLANASVNDFVIVEYNGDLGGRVAHTTFGAQPNGKPYIVELGANWIQGLQTDDGPINPIWALAQKYGIKNTYSDYDSIETFDQTGSVNYTDLLTELDDAYTEYEVDAGYIITDNLQDTSVRAGLSLAGWKPKKDMRKQAVEWWYFDWEYSYTPEVSSALWSVVNYNTTFYQWSDENNFVYDSRGFNTIIKGEASEFLNCTNDYDCSGDERLLLNTIVTNITHSNDGVTVHNKDGSCISAQYAVCTFSIGVLQNEAVTFEPALPAWKERALATFQMGTYTKIFLQFPPDQVFWDTDTQFFLYADPDTRGYYPVFQSLDGPGFLKGSGILFVTVVYEQSYTVESQDPEITKQQVLEVLRKMYGAKNVPMPTAFMYPKWSLEPWTYGSYSNWPTGTTLEQHQNLRANLGRVYFAGEATSTEYYGFLQGAYYEGISAAETIIGCLNNTQSCEPYARYQVLHGTTTENEYNATNGVEITPFQTNGF